MIGKLLTGLAGDAAARMLGASGPAGAAIGAALPFVARRLGPWGMVGLAVGGWAARRVRAAPAARLPAPAAPAPAPKALSPAPTADPPG